MIKSSKGTIYELGFDFMGLIKLEGKYIRNKYIIVTTYYVTKVGGSKNIEN